MWLAENKGLEIAKGTFSRFFELQLPPDASNLNKIDMTRLFTGALSREVSEIFQSQLELWMELQEERIRGEATRRNSTDVQEKFTDVLRTAINKLEEITFVCSPQTSPPAGWQLGVPLLPASGQ
jgi:hypothetical protein